MIVIELDDDFPRELNEARPDGFLKNSKWELAPSAKSVIGVPSQIVISFDPSNAPSDEDMLDLDGFAFVIIVTVVAVSVGSVKADELITILNWTSVEPALANWIASVPTIGHV